MYNVNEQKKMEDIYGESGNQLLLLYGSMNCEKEKLLKEFVSDKKFFYYRAREASEKEQLFMMQEEIRRKYDVRLQKDSYEECFNRIKSGDASKLVVIIDEFERIVKKDSSFMESILKLKKKQLYPGPVFIILATSSIVWAEQDMKNVLSNQWKHFREVIKIGNMNFLEVVRAFPSFSVSETIQIYGVLGGVPGYLCRWNQKKTLKENICELILSPSGYLFSMAEQIISSELRELSVYNTILMAIAKGENKLNDLFLYTGYSRAKISVYMKNLSHFDIIEKVVSFETGGWDNAKKAVYRIKDTYINFYYRFIYPHLSDLYMLSAEEFYDLYIENDLDDYLERYFRDVCMEYLFLLNQMKRLPVSIEKLGTWIGKVGQIDIIGQSLNREKIVGLCNWKQGSLTMDMCKDLFQAMERAKITSNHIYLFSANRFEREVIEMAKEDSRFELIDMNEL